jgi:hypothetical protein
MSMTLSRDSSYVCIRTGGSVCLEAPEVVQVPSQEKPCQAGDDDGGADGLTAQAAAVLERNGAG